MPTFVSLYLYVPDEGSLLPKYRDCTTSNDFESYIIIYIYFIHIIIIMVLYISTVTGMYDLAEDCSTKCTLDE